jgi:hypothetical protein
MGGRRSAGDGAETAAGAAAGFGWGAGGGFALAGLAVALGAGVAIAGPGLPAAAFCTAGLAAAVAFDTALAMTGPAAGFAGAVLLTDVVWAAFAAAGAARAGVVGRETAAPRAFAAVPADTFIPDTSEPCPSCTAAWPVIGTTGHTPVPAHPAPNDRLLEMVPAVASAAQPPSPIQTNIASQGRYVIGEGIRRNIMIRHTSG